MIVSWRWISQWVDTAGVDPVAFAQRFTCTVAEIDGVHQHGQGLGAVCVANVIAVEPHPNADKLRVVTVDIGQRTVTVVCGAPNVRVGLRVPFVPPGVKLPSGIEVRDGAVRGIASPGMLASEADLGLSDDHAGLLELDGCSAPAGTSLPDAVAITDVIYDVDNKAITHRPDLWGQYGMAREIAAMIGQPLRSLDVQVRLGQGDPLPVTVSPLAPCPRYLCARVDGLDIAPSPVDSRLQLRRCGVRPINNAVDATNWVMLETGNPLHAFDARDLRGARLEVRLARTGEQITTLDGQLRNLQPQDCVIADAEGAVALAGIMGGENSEIKADTKSLVLEAACFDAPAIRKTAMRLGLRSESSARFEKALDPHLAHTAALRALQLLQSWSPNARIVSNLSDNGPFAQSPTPPVLLQTTSTYLRARLGVSPEEMSDQWVDNCLHRLAFVVQRQGDAMTVTVPSFRATKDVRIADDLIEELGRHYGYSNIASIAPLVPARPSETPYLRLLERQLRQRLVDGHGLTEVILYGFDHETERTRLGLHEHGLPRQAVLNAISAPHQAMRRNLAGNLLAALERNLSTGDGRQVAKKGLQIGLFEIGRAFVPVGDESDPLRSDPHRDWGLPAVLRQLGPARDAYLARMDPELRQSCEQASDKARPLPLQPMRLGLVLGERLGGGAEGMKTAAPPPELTRRLYSEAVMALQDVAATTGAGTLQCLPWTENTLWNPALPDIGASWLHPQRTAVLQVGGVAVGYVGMLHPRVRQAFEVPAEVVVAELDLRLLSELPTLPVLGKAPVPHAPSYLDLTLTVQPPVRAHDVDLALRSVRPDDPQIHCQVELLYASAADGDETLGIAQTWRIQLLHPSRALPLEETTALHQRFQQATQALAAPISPVVQS